MSRRKPLSKQDRKTKKKRLLISFTLGLFLSATILTFNKNLILSAISFFLVFIISLLYFHFKKELKISGRIRKIEGVFPDFLQLMSSNLRAGMTIDRSILISSRPEFRPLDEEILKTGRDITTGKGAGEALLNMADRIGSEKIKKTILLIISGIKSGGDLAILLEETSVNLREREFLEKKASSNVLMYVIFISMAVAVFAPGLFSLSTVLVEILTEIMSGVPVQDTTVNMPFTFSGINVSTNFIKYFSILFIVVIDFFACLILGLVNKGNEKEGLKYLLPILASSLFVFFMARILIGRFMGGLL